MKERNSYGKIMKRNWILTLGIISALSITACGGNQAGQKESSAQTAGYESEAQDAGSQGGDAINGEEQLYCIVNEAGDGMLNVSDMEGNYYTFQTDAAGLQVNDKIFVYYTGNLEDGSAQVLRIEKYEDEE